jgi:hypothetical protein
MQHGLYHIVVLAHNDDFGFSFPPVAFPRATLENK